MKTRQFQCFVLTLCLALLTACSGVPLRSVPRLLQLQNELLQSNPAEFIVAIQVDARLVPPPGAVPLLAVKVEPRDAGAFQAIDKKLALQMAVSAASTFGLPAPSAGRRWLVYSMPPATQAELLLVQSTIRQAKAMPNSAGRGSLSVGIEQHALAVTEPALANTDWETWLQTRKSDGFFELWTRTPAMLLAEAAKRKK